MREREDLQSLDRLHHLYLLAVDPLRHFDRLTAALLRLGAQFALQTLRDLRESEHVQPTLKHLRTICAASCE